MKNSQNDVETLGIKKLSNTEMEFMDVIWAHPEGITSEEIYAKLWCAAARIIFMFLKLRKRHISVPFLWKK